MSDLLTQHLRTSDTNPFLRIGPEAPTSRPGWVYRDFYKMPLATWESLLSLLGENEYILCSTNSKQLPPAKFCRASLWISPLAQERWAQYLKQHTNEGHSPCHIYPS